MPVNPQNPTNDPNLPGYDENLPTVGQNVEPTNQVQQNVEPATPIGQAGTGLNTFANIILGAGIIFLLGSVLYAVFSKPEA